MGVSPQPKRKHEDPEVRQAMFNSLYNPTTEKPYIGPPLEYHFVDTQVNL